MIAAAIITYLLGIVFVLALVAGASIASEDDHE